MTTWIEKRKHRSGKWKNWIVEVRYHHAPQFVATGISRDLRYAEDEAYNKLKEIFEAEGLTWIEPSRINNR